MGQNDRTTELQNDRTTELQNDRMTERQNDRTTEGKNRTAESAKWRDGRTLPTYHIYGRKAKIMFGTRRRILEQRYLPTTFIIDSGIGTYLNDLWYTPTDTFGRQPRQLLIFYIYKPIGPSALSQTESVLVLFVFGIGKA